MARFKVRLVTTIEVPVSCDFEMEDEDLESAEQTAMDEYARLCEADRKAKKDWRDGVSTKVPTYQINWDVDVADIENNIDDDEVELDSIEEA